MRLTCVTDAYLWDEKILWMEEIKYLYLPLPCSPRSARSGKTRARTNSATTPGDLDWYSHLFWTSDLCTHQPGSHRRKVTQDFSINRNTQKNMQLLDKIHTVFTAALNHEEGEHGSNSEISGLD